MALDLTGIGFENEFYSDYYVAELLPGDLAEALERHKSTTALEDWREACAAWAEADSDDARKEAQRGWLARMFTALGYEWLPGERPCAGDDNDGAIAILGEIRRPDGHPLLWLLEAEVPSKEGGPASEFADPLSLPADPSRPDGPTWEERIARDIFAGPEPPRWLLLAHLGQLVLLDRTKWADGRLLRFTFRELVTRRDAIRAFASLAAHGSLCPGAPGAEEGLLDRLDDHSLRHAAGVSGDLKLAVREAIELLGNEALYYWREVRKEAVYAGAMDPAALGRESLRYLYRLLFLFYLEARPGLGLAPMRSEEYRTGYSLDALRELALTPLASEQSRAGHFLDDSIRKLFGLVYKGHGHGPAQFDLRAAGAAAAAAVGPSGASSRGFTLKPLDADLFDEALTPKLRSVRFRNVVWQRVLELLGYSRAERGAARRRISYAELGISQLGAVYEGLLSYTGFFAKADLYEVKKAGSTSDPLQQAWFVTKDKLGEYQEDEKVFDETGAVRCYPQGTFIYRLNGRGRQSSASYYTPEVLTRCVVKYALQDLLAERPADEILALNVCEPALGSGAFLNEALNQLADAYLERKQTELGRPLGADALEDARQKVKAYLADNRVFGVDRNPVAVELAEISLWLNTIHAGQIIPWFSAQLASGDSLIGARREYFSAARIVDKSRPWLKTAPTAVTKEAPRPDDGVYHFLLPDDGMSEYPDKVVKALCPADIARIKAWRRGFCSHFDAAGAATLVRLSAAADRLFARHAEALAGLRARAGHTFPIFGHEDWKEPDSALSTRDRQKLFNDALRPAAGPSSAYQRLKFAMDYWCALWFWPVEQAALLPTRDEFLLEVGSILEGTARATRNIRPAQAAMFGPMQPSLTSADEAGFVTLSELVAASERLKLVEQIAARQRFLHWELEFADIFAARGGFDLVLGNPPWIKIEWNEGDVMSDFQPLYALRKYTAPELAKLRAEAMGKLPGLRQAYLAEYVACQGQQAFLNARQNYPLLLGSQTNTFKCFLALATRLAAFAGFVHDDGAFNDPKAALLRRDLYPRLRYLFQFENELSLFEGTNDHGRMRFEVSILGPPRVPSFNAIANLFHPATIDACFAHDGHGPVPGIKDEAGHWNLAGHAHRVIEVDEAALDLFARLYDKPGTPAPEARLPSLHAQELVAVLRKFADYPTRLSSLAGRYSATEMWHQTNAVTDGTIRPAAGHFARDPGEWILSGPHIFVATPFYQTPRAVCDNNQAYDLLDLTALPEDYLPRTNYLPACSAAEYRARTPTVPWGKQEPVTNFYRLVNREMLSQAGERTLLAAIVSPGAAHVHTVFDLAFEDVGDLVRLAAAAFSLPVDFHVKGTGMGHANQNLMAQLPLPAGSPPLIARTLLLNCLTVHYAELWQACFDPAFLAERWTKADPRLDDAHFAQLAPDWRWATPLRTQYARRQALIELDVLVAMELGLSCDELCSIYRMQFPVLRQYERETYYDRAGRIVFCAGDSKWGLASPEWKRPRHQDRIERVINDDTLPGGPRQRTIVHEGPFDTCDREQDYRTAWAEFERRRAGNIKKSKAGAP